MAKKASRTLSHLDFLKVYEWVKTNIDYVRTRPPKERLAKKASSDLKMDVAIFTLETCMKDLGLSYSNKGKRRVGPRLTQEFMADVVLRVHNLLHKELDHTILSPEEIAKLQSIRDNTQAADSVG